MILNPQTLVLWKLWQSPSGRKPVAIGMIVLCLCSVVCGQDSTASDEGDIAELVFAIREPDKGISDIVASRDGKMIFSTSYGLRPTLWDVATGSSDAANRFFATRRWSRLRQETVFVNLHRSAKPRHQSDSRRL